MEIEIIDAIGNAHMLNINVSHNVRGQMFMSMIFDDGNEHYVLDTTAIRQMMNAITEEVR